jgi:release factor glutamine methyltransferase
MDCVSPAEQSKGTGEGSRLSQESQELLGRLHRQYGDRIKLNADKPEESLESTMRALWLCAVGQPVSSVKAMEVPLPDPTPEQAAKITELLDQRAGGVPLAYLTGRQSFMGFEFQCGPAALIPRRETELLGATACSLVRGEILLRTAHPQVLDLCTGTGNLACAIARQLPQCNLVASDLSAEACDLARQNARTLQVEDRVRVLVGDLFAPFEHNQLANCFDLIMCNPPYISAARLPRMEPEIIQHEPRMAFDGGAFGLGVLSRLLRDAPRFIGPEGWLAFEAGAGQGAGLVKRLAKDPQYRRVDGVPDSNGEVRVVIAQVAR